MWLSDTFYISNIIYILLYIIPKQVVLCCRNGWKLQTSEWNCSNTWRRRCRRISVWRRNPVLRRKMSSCRWISSTLWSVSCLEKILGKVWRNWNRAVLPPNSVDVSLNRGRLSTLAGQITAGFQPEKRMDWTGLYVEIIDVFPLSFQGLCNRPHLCHVHGLLPRQCSQKPSLQGWCHRNL